MKRLFLRVLLIAMLVPFSSRAAESESGGGTLSGFFAAHRFVNANISLRQENHLFLNVSINHVGGASGMAYERYGRPEFIFAPSEALSRNPVRPVPQCGGNLLTKP